MERQRQLSSYPKRAFIFVRHNQFLTFLIVAGVVIVIRDLFVVFASGYEWRSGTGFAGKTLWDWMDLLIIPIVLAVGAFLLNRSERRNEIEIAEQAREIDREIAANRQGEVALQSYYDKMTALLLDESLRESAEKSEVRIVARARTLSALNSLDAHRKKALLRFLYECYLISGDSPVVSLSSANLQGVNLTSGVFHEINLYGVDLGDAVLDICVLNGACLAAANLTGASLRGAQLEKANLYGCIAVRTNLGSRLMPGKVRRLSTNLKGALLESSWLTYANLKRANLQGAYLKNSVLAGADLSYAKLIEADLLDAVLEEADLSKADLTNARVSEEQLKSAKSLKGAIMPDGTVHE